MKREKSLDIALQKILSLFGKQDVKQITIQRKYLPEIFNVDLLVISKNDGLPTLQPFILEFFKMKTIKIKYFIDEVQFELINPYQEMKKSQARLKQLIKSKGIEKNKIPISTTKEREITEVPPPKEKKIKFMAEKKRKKGGYSFKKNKWLAEHIWEL